MHRQTLGSAVLLFVAVGASGSPEPTIRFRDLVAQSSAVVLADVVESATADTKRTVRATTVEVLSGVAPRKLTIIWRDKGVLQPDVSGRYVLFVKATSDGTFAPAAAMWSFWKVLPEAGASVGCRIAVDYTFVIDHIRGLEKAKIDVIEPNGSKPAGAVTIICVDRLRKLLALRF